MATNKIYYNIKQFRYFGYLNINQSSSIFTINNTLTNNVDEASTLVSGTIFDQYTPIISLGIQTLPGVSFYLNSSPDPIIIGYGGVFELDLTDSEARIARLQFSQESLQLIENSPGGYLIIDIKYEERERQNL